ncbi:NAD(P)H-quinone oxidoreductase subunit S [Spatholobus suberectus]|nr:NAD(P)H-quinone oxidoreductase subunit S [Spatholobus suberectus]
MATFPSLHGLHNPLPRSQFLGHDHPLTHHFPLKQPPSTVHHKTPTTHEVLKLRAKFNILELLGGRGLCNGEKGLQQELERQVVVDDQPQPPSSPAEAASSGKEEEGSGSEGSVKVPEDGFEKEMMGLTGGFPGGEKGLQKFIEKNTPPKPANVVTMSF